MSRRLLNRGQTVRASNAPSASTTTTTTTTTVADLPDYEPLSFPLSEDARRELGQLSNNRGTAAYESQLKDSIRHLGSSVGDLQERLRARKDRLSELQTRRQEKGTDKSTEEERLEERLPDLEKEIDRLTRDSERSLREVIDSRVELEDEAAVLNELFTHAATENGTTNPTFSRSRRANEDPDLDGGEDEDEDRKQEVHVESILDKYRSLRNRKKKTYTKMSPHERYAINNDYAGFKKLWHDAAAGEDGPPLPDASKWFLANGEPDMAVMGQDGQSGDHSDDDDVAVARETISINCPLTLLPMVEPYGNRKCPHTFEKSAILDYLPARGEVQCPQTGCSQTFSRAKFKDEFFLNEAMLRRIQRTRQAEAARNDMDDDDDEEGANDSLVLGTQRRVRGERLVKRERMAVHE